MNILTRTVTGLLGALSALSLIFFPVLFWQGKKVRRDTLVMPEGAGPREGSCGIGDPVLSLLVVGDSVGASVGASTQEQGLAGSVAGALADRLQQRIDWAVAARSGAESADLSRELLCGVSANQLDCVVVSIGVNDIVRWTLARRWESNLEKFERDLHERVGVVPLLMLGIPPLIHFPALPFPLRQIVALRGTYIDRLLRQWCERSQERIYVNIDPDHDGMAFAPDGFHPGESAYPLIGQAVAEVATETLVL